MRSEWPEEELDELLEAVIDHRGRTPKKLGGDFASHGVPVISAKNVKNSRLDLDESLRFIEPAMWDKWMPVKLAEGDVLLTSEAPLGETAYLAAPEPLCLGQRLFALRASQTRLNSHYLFYALQGPTLRNRILARASGTTAQGIRQSELVRVRVPVPPIDEQRRIAEILGALDDKIESSRRLVKTLEEMSATLFNARFVNFVDVVGCRDLVESELGPIPRDWSVCQLDQVSAVLTRGRAPVYIEEGGTLVLNQKCVRDGRVTFEAARRHNEEARNSKDRRVEIGDVLINSTGVGTLGRVAQVRWLPEPATVDGHVTLVRAATPDVVQDYLALTLLSRQVDLERMAHGSTGQTELTRSRLAEMPIVVPPRSEQDLLRRFYGPIREKIGSLERESIALSRIRDALLPKLVSGEVRVCQASFAESAR
jgi:type I restriction enzyme S subunit